MHNAYTSARNVQRYAEADQRWRMSQNAVRRRTAAVQEQNGSSERLVGIRL